MRWRADNAMIAINLLQLWIKLEVTIRSVSISSYSESWVRSKMAGFTYLELLILLFQPCSPAGQQFDPVRQDLGDGSQHILGPTLDAVGAVVGPPWAPQNSYILNK